MSKFSWQTLIQILLVFGCFGLTAIDVFAQESSGLVEPVVRIPVGASGGIVEVTFKSAKAPNSPPRIEDQPLPVTAATVTFSPVDSAGTAARIEWRYRLDVKGLPPSTAGQQRYAKVAYADNTTETFTYVLSNMSAAAFSWAIAKPPETWVSSAFPWGSSCTSFTVTPKDSLATDVTINAALVEESTKSAITSDKVRLCVGNKDCTGNDRILLPANTPSTLRLCTTETFHGTFNGPVTLISKEKPEGEPVLAKAEFSSLLAKVAGFIVIVFGVLIALLAKIYARARFERNQALLPAIEMRSQLELLEKQLASIGPIYLPLCVKVPELIKSLLQQLSTETLDRKQLLPPKIPAPFGTAPDPVAYKNYLELRSPQIQVCVILIRKGIVQAVAKDTGSLTEPQKEAVKKAVRDIDAIAGLDPLPTPAVALEQVVAILNTLQQRLLEDAAGFAGEPVPPLTAAQEFNVISFEIESISKGIWLLYALLTSLAGLVVLILNNAGFGVPVDFVFAFFWGFAVPTAVDQLTPASVATALNISVPRTQ